MKKNRGQRKRREGRERRSVFVGSCQEVISLLTDFLITFGKTDKCVLVCLWMPVCVVQFQSAVFCILSSWDNHINVSMHYLC